MSKLWQSIFSPISKQRLLVEKERLCAPGRHPVHSPRSYFALAAKSFRRRRSSRPPRGRRCRSTATTATITATTATAAAVIAAIAAAATSTSSTCRRRPRPGFSPGGRPAHSSLLRPCALHPRPCELPASLLPASGVAGDAVATLCASSRGTGARLPHPAYAHASAALAWQAVAVQMGLAAGSRSGGRQVAKSRVAFCRSFRLRGSPRSEAGFA